MDSRGTPPEMSNFYCLPGRAGGTPKCIRACRQFATMGRAAGLIVVRQPMN